MSVLVGHLKKKVAPLTPKTKRVANQHQQAARRKKNVDSHDQWISP